MNHTFGVFSQLILNIRCGLHALNIFSWVHFRQSHFETKALRQYFVFILFRLYIDVHLLKLTQHFLMSIYGNQNISLPYLLVGYRGKTHFRGDGNLRSRTNLMQKSPGLWFLFLLFLINLTEIWDNSQRQVLWLWQKRWRFLWWNFNRFLLQNIAHNLLWNFTAIFRFLFSRGFHSRRINYFSAHFFVSGSFLGLLIECLNRVFSYFRGRSWILWILKLILFLKIANILQIYRLRLLRGFWPFRKKFISVRCTFLLI